MCPDGEGAVGAVRGGAKRDARTSSSDSYTTASYTFFFSVVRVRLIERLLLYHRGCVMLFRRQRPSGFIPARIIYKTAVGARAIKNNLHSAANVRSTAVYTDTNDAQWAAEADGAASDISEVASIS